MRLELPVIPLRNTVILPHITTAVDVGRAKSKRAVEEAMGADRLIFLSGVIGAIVAVGLVYGPWTMPLPPMRGEAGSRDQAPATGLDRDGGRG